MGVSACSCDGLIGEYWYMHNIYHFALQWKIQHGSTEILLQCHSSSHTVIV